LTASRSPSSTAPRGLPWLGPALLPAVFVALAVWSWRRWPDVLVDFGRELYVPWQLAAGKALYADIAYFNGPLSPWLNSLVFRTFGVGLVTLVVANLAVIVAISVMLYVLLREMGGRFTATVGTLVFLTVFAFGQYIRQANFDYVTPYSHEMTHGTALSLAAMVLLRIHLRRGGVGSALGCGLAVGLTFLTKAELFVAVAFAVVVGLVLHHGLGRYSLRTALRVGGVFAAGVALPPLVAFLVLLRGLPQGAAIDGVLGSWNYVFVTELRELKFYRDILGTTDIGESLRIIGRWTFRYALFLVPPAVIALLIRPTGRYSRLVAGSLVPLAAIAVLHDRRGIDWEFLARPYPLALLAGVGILVMLVMRPDATEAQRVRRVLGLSFVLYALALLLKMILAVRFMHYGFALAMPATMVLVVALLDGIPRLIDDRGRYGTAFRAAGLGILIGIAGMHLYATNTWFRLRTVEVGRGPDAFLADNRGRIVRRILERLERLPSAGETLAVLPEGVMLNYLSRMRNPTPHINFMPPELIMFGEERILREFDANPPDWIVMAYRTAPEYGDVLLGHDYGTGILAWIEANYRLVERLENEGARDPQLLYALILRRRGTASGGGPTADH